MKTRRILAAMFSVLVIVSIALSMTPFLTETAYGAECPSNYHRGTYCPWNPDYWYDVLIDCCCNPSTGQVTC